MRCERAILRFFRRWLSRFGLGLAESMATGCPIAAADLLYAHDVCDEAAIYFDPYNSESLAKVVTSVCREPVRLAEMKAKGMERKALYSYETIAEQIAKTLESAVGDINKEAV